MATSTKSDACPLHPDAALIEDSSAGDQICSDCGLVVGHRVVDRGSEWRTFNNEESSTERSRVGAPEKPYRSGSDLTTIIGPSPSGPSKFKIGGPKYRNRKSLTSTNRTLEDGFLQIASMADKMNLPSCIVDRANVLFKRVQDGKHLRGHSSDGIIAACLNIACRQEGVPRGFKEICAVSMVSKVESSRCYNYVRKVLKISVDSTTSGDFMARFGSNLELPYKVQRVATDIAEQAVKMDIVSGRSPISVAAAAIYMASQASEDKRSAKQIEEITGVAIGTIRQAFRLMYPQAAQLFPKDFEFATTIDKLPRL